MDIVFKRLRCFENDSNLSNDDEGTMITDRLKRLWLEWSAPRCAKNVR